MRYAHFDETGNVITAGFPGQMKVSMVFSDETNDETGATDWFNKRERFRNTLFGYTCWDMVLNFGFRTLEDGTRECYHFGELPENPLDCDIRSCSRDLFETSLMRVILMI